MTSAGPCAPRIALSDDVGPATVTLAAEPTPDAHRRLDLTRPVAASPPDHSIAALVTGPGGFAIVAIACACGCVAVTAFGAAPIHSRLAEPDVRLLRRLLLIDRLRTMLAAGCLAAAVAAAV